MSELRHRRRSEQQRSEPAEPADPALDPEGEEEEEGDEWAHKPFQPSSPFPPVIHPADQARGPPQHYSYKVLLFLAFGLGVCGLELYLATQSIHIVGQLLAAVCGFLLLVVTVVGDVKDDNSPEFVWIPRVSYGLLSFISLLALIQVTSIHGKITDFPNQCSRSVEGCARLTPFDTHRVELPAPIINAVPEKALAAIERFLNSDFTATSQIVHVDATKGLIHASSTSSFWGFVDDVVVQLKCKEMKSSQWSNDLTSCNVSSKQQIFVAIHSELRIGRRDFNVNPGNVEKISTFLSKAF